MLSTPACRARPRVEHACTPSTPACQVRLHAEVRMYLARHKRPSAMSGLDCAFCGQPPPTYMLS
eukprot:231852-Chlamydomonas_euryale.AAC.1